MYWKNGLHGTYFEWYSFCVFIHASIAFIGMYGMYRFWYAFEHNGTSCNYWTVLVWFICICMCLTESVCISKYWSLFTVLECIGMHGTYHTYWSVLFCIYNIIGLYCVYILYYTHMFIGLLVLTCIVPRYMLNTCTMHTNTYHNTCQFGPLGPKPVSRTTIHANLVPQGKNQSSEPIMVYICYVSWYVLVCISMYFVCICMYCGISWHVLCWCWPVLKCNTCWSENQGLRP